MSSEGAMPLNQQWTAHFDTLRDYIFVAVCDPFCCQLAIEVIRRFIYFSPLQESILKEGSFKGILRLLFPEGDS
jgi:hypothetical protein